MSGKILNTPKQKRIQDCCNIQGGALCDNSSRLPAANYYHKELQLGCCSSPRPVSDNFFIDWLIFLHVFFFTTIFRMDSFMFCQLKTFKYKFILVPIFLYLKLIKNHQVAFIPNFSRLGKVLKINESQYIALSVVSGSIGKLFSIEYVNIYLFSIFLSIDFTLQFINFKGNYLKLDSNFLVCMFVELTK